MAWSRRELLTGLRRKLASRVTGVDRRKVVITTEPSPVEPVSEPSESPPPWKTNPPSQS